MTDNTTVTYTSMSVFYPDGTEAQRNGLKIDYYINENATNYNPNTYLNKNYYHLNFKIKGYKIFILAIPLQSILPL